MAYITKEEVAVMRKSIKTAYPIKDGWKFSVRKNAHSSTVSIRLVQYPAGYAFAEFKNINPHSVEINAERNGWGEKELEVVRTMDAVAHDGHWDKSDIMTDYFNCSWYINLSIGTWEKPAVAVDINK